MACSPTKSTPPQPAVVCNESAFVNVTDFQVEKLKTKDDKEFHQWANEIIVKQPTLINAYSDLRECWEYYHGNPTTTASSSKKNP